MTVGAVSENAQPKRYEKRHLCVSQLVFCTIFYKTMVNKDNKSIDRIYEENVNTEMNFFHSDPTAYSWGYNNY